MWAQPSWPWQDSLPHVDRLERKLELLERRAEAARQQRDRKQQWTPSTGVAMKRRRRQAEWTGYNKDELKQPTVRPATSTLGLSTLSAFQLDRLLVAYSNELLATAGRSFAAIAPPTAAQSERAAVVSLSSLDAAIAAVRQQRAEEERTARKERVLAVMIAEKSAVLEQQQAMLNSERRRRRNEQSTVRPTTPLTAQLRTEGRADEQRWLEHRRVARSHSDERMEASRYWSVRAERERLEARLGAVGTGSGSTLSVQYGSESRSDSKPGATQQSHSTLAAYEQPHQHTTQPMTAVDDSRQPMEVSQFAVVGAQQRQNEGHSNRQSPHPAPLEESLHSSLLRADTHATTDPLQTAGRPQPQPQSAALRQATVQHLGSVHQQAAWSERHKAVTSEEEEEPEVDVNAEAGDVKAEVDVAVDEDEPTVQSTPSLLAAPSHEGRMEADSNAIHTPTTFVAKDKERFNQSQPRVSQPALLGGGVERRDSSFGRQQLSALTGEPNSTLRPQLVAVPLQPTTVRDSTPQVAAHCSDDQQQAATSEAERVVGVAGSDALKSVTRRDETEQSNAGRVVSAVSTDSSGLQQRLAVQSSSVQPAAVIKKKSLFGFLSKFRRSSSRGSSSSQPAEPTNNANNTRSTSSSKPPTQPSAAMQGNAGGDSHTGSEEGEADDDSSNSDSDAESDVRRPPHLDGTATLSSSLPSSVNSSQSVLHSNSLAVTQPAGRSSLASASLLAPRNPTAATARRLGSSGLAIGHSGSLSGGYNGASPLQSSLNSHSPLPSLTALQPSALIAQRKPLQPTGKATTANRATFQTSRFLSDLGGDDGELSDDDDDEGPPKTLRPAPARIGAHFAASTGGTATARMTGLVTQRQAAVKKSNTAPVMASVIANQEGDEFDF